MIRCCKLRDGNGRKFIALDHDLTNWAKQLIAHPRAALFVQQVKANIVILDGRIELDRDGDQTEGKAAAEMGRSRVVKGGREEHNEKARKSKKHQVR